MAPKGKSGKHYTAVDKKIFLEILKKYKNIVEQKKSDAGSLREKESAWNEIAEKFNGVLQISETRTVPQLKKLWSNMKQSQRDALTQEKQARMATGGGPEIPEAQVDPDIAAIVPHLMTLAPTEFSSNIIPGEQAIAMGSVLENDDDSLFEFQDVEYLLDASIDRPPTEPIPSCSSGIPVQTCKKMRAAAKRSRSESSSHFSASKSIAQKAMEEAVTQRLDALSAEDRELFQMKKDREQRMSKLMEDNENDIHLLKVQHLLRIQELEIRKATAEAELAEFKLARERDNL
ncbi:uncharacterized protein LOC107228077 isoform X1 [Neodiprion lecontei]|uniref:Regulatory protein zeste n=1 Tax=Neodiprion lecontei TaxID=441921 RepID=A0ABM3FCQ4_NEOLC|nr:uncharacterized protein LOC124292622 [Neodiprion lecontei]XP_046585797.1 uncharacterized protein LOC124292622 [Neodiprion lecontei]XP_046585798.1 uncharacterized protein LOC124292623 isoform X1 [Neodiprion lecontei]XP_046585799.1 uncharacterized protein LOC124292623 isoform X1 [Neodiprion lecontei]XP_046585802.1 uncharacterized protein LOC107227832 isoform X1 [Neodiprion lecontei]XP_046585803.1 uncharacterized protein LOC107227832 isoform X1 [Neodiprion lecontei]XP_046596405.1 uncharacteri